MAKVQSVLQHVRALMHPYREHILYGASETSASRNTTPLWLVGVAISLIALFLFGVDNLSHDPVTVTVVAVRYSSTVRVRRYWRGDSYSYVIFESTRSGTGSPVWTDTAESGITFGPSDRFERTATCSIVVSLSTGETMSFDTECSNGLNHGVGYSWISTREHPMRGSPFTTY